MDTNTKTKTSGMSEIRELTNHELNAVNGGAYNAYLSQGGGAGAGKVEPYQTGGSGGSHS
jgi:bacteriocin-like protein